MIIALVVGEKFPAVNRTAFTLVLGFVAYGLSVFVYIRAQKELGAAKTGAYYAVAPFIGAVLSLAGLQETLTVAFASSLIIMLLGTFKVVIDTLKSTIIICFSDNLLAPHLSQLLIPHRQKIRRGS